MLDNEFGAPPAAETTALHDLIRTGEFGRGVGQQTDQAAPTTQDLPKPLSTLAPIANRQSQIRNRHNLPLQTTPFIGREVELAELSKVYSGFCIGIFSAIRPDKPFLDRTGGPGSG
jgi:hypothetical protein